jgi:hypothetical protein
MGCWGTYVMADFPISCVSRVDECIIRKIQVEPRKDYNCFKGVQKPVHSVFFVNVCKSLCSGADYTSDLVRDLLHIADAIRCICDLVSDKNPFLYFFATNCRRDLVCDSVSVFSCAEIMHAPNRMHQIAHQIAC